MKRKGQPVLPLFCPRALNGVAAANPSLLRSCSSVRTRGDKPAPSGVRIYQRFWRSLRIAASWAASDATSASTAATSCLSRALGPEVQFLGVVYEDEEQSVRQFLARQGSAY